ncbi:P-loop containing nucleoside triphosphate hydrolase protein [Penicillium herquei]|nr:P-loop containing nucleoside triphosphate hydrolase protein [Penicillium herquei]
MASTAGFRDGRVPRENDIFIAVMGVTGSGKSSFISLCAKKHVKIGHDLNSCTAAVSVYTYDISSNRTVYLIDTPGFDDTNRSDTQVLSEIAAWLGNSYKNKIELTGILYFHRISDIRLQGSAKRNLIMFTQLCGEAALTKVILVTTMWDKIPVDEATRREKELFETPEFWGYMMSKGSTSHRHNNTKQSARMIVDRLIKSGTTFATSLQKELIDERRTLDQTSAGREMESELLKEKAKWQRERQEIEKSMKVAIEQQNREAEQAMLEERDRYTQLIKKAEQDTGSLRSDMEKLLAQRDIRFAEMEKQLKEATDDKDSALLSVEIERIKRARARKRVERDQAKLEEQTPAHERFSLSSPESDNDHDYDYDRMDRPMWARRRCRDADAHSRERVHPRYWVVIHGSRFGVFSPSLGVSQGATEMYRKDSACIAAVSYGGSCKADDEPLRVVRYTNGEWVIDLDLAEAYPGLSDKISFQGKQNLMMCILGPGFSYFARWKNGYCSYRGSSGFKSAADYHTHRQRSKIMTVDFGYKGSWLMSSGRRSAMDRLKSSWNLKGYYPRLQRLLDSHKDISVVAVSLDSTNPTSYVLIFKAHDGYHIHWRSSSKQTSDIIHDWWYRR